MKHSASAMPLLAVGVTPCKRSDERRVIQHPLLAMAPETVSSILLYLPYSEASALVATLEDSSQTKSSFGTLPAWREFFRRRGFSMQDPVPENDYHGEYQRRHQLCEAFSSANAMIRQPGFVSFASLQPVEMWVPQAAGHDNAMRSITSSPRVSWDLGSTAVGPELIILDTDALGSTVLSVHADPLAEEFRLRRTETDLIRLDSPLSGYSTRHPDSIRTSPQLLLSTPSGHGRRWHNAHLLPVKPVFGSDQRVTGGTMIAIVWDEPCDHPPVPASTAVDIVSTRFQFWQRPAVPGGANRPETPPAYSKCGSCLVRGTYAWVDFSATDHVNDRLVYVLRSATEARSGYASTMEAYPVTFHRDNQGGKATDVYARPKFTMDCQDYILSCCLCPTGQRVTVVTVKGDLQIWTVDETQAIMTVSIPSRPVVEDAFDGQRNLDFLKAMLGTSTALMAARRPESTQQISMHLPRHLSMEHCGFLTFHTTKDSLERSANGNHTVLLWEKIHGKSDGDLHGGWVVSALINLPLLLIRQPHVYYDGNRFIALGQDFLGILILVYQVHHTEDSRPTNSASCRANEARAPGATEASGGVYNFGPIRVQFANRIRHDIGGSRIEHMEPLEMTCNERYLVVRAKTEDSLSFRSDGLLVFDLQNPTSMVERFDTEFGGRVHC